MLKLKTHSGFLHTATEKLNGKKSKTLFHQYLEMAPNCDKQFPNEYYMLAKFVAKANIDEALRYCALAEKVKNERLPFLQPIRISQKKNDANFKSQLDKCMKFSHSTTITFSLFTFLLFIIIIIIFINISFFR
jgi:hypothetical protein